MNIREMLDKILNPKKRERKPTHMIIGEATEPHFFGGRHRKVRKIVKRYGGNMTRMIAENPHLRDVKVEQRPVRFVREIDYQAEYRKKRWAK